MNAATDTATPARIKIIRDMVAESQGAYSELCDTFRAEGMGNADADTAAWALWVRYLHGELDITETEDTDMDTEPTVTVTFPAALRDIIADTDALDGLHTAPGGARGSLRITGTREQLADFTIERLWACAYNTASDARERAAYRRWIDAIEAAGIIL